MIYCLDRKKLHGAADTDFLQVEPIRLGEAPRCPACSRFVGMLQWQPPFRAELESWGSAYGDVVYGPGDSLLVSERFASLWAAEALTGLIGFEPVEIVASGRRHKAKGPPPSYRHVTAMRSNVALNAQQCGFEWTEAPACAVCRVGTMRGWRRIVLENPPVEDVFIARGLPGVVLVSERFHSFCDDNGITNVHLVPGPEAENWFGLPAPPG